MGPCHHHISLLSFLIDLREKKESLVQVFLYIFFFFLKRLS